MNWEIIWEHLYLVLAACICVTVTGVPLGIYSYCFPRQGKVILTVVDLLQTVPVLAIMGLLMTVFGANSVTVIFSMVLYLLLPIVRNTNTGLKRVPFVLKETAAAMGMNRTQRLMQVELPLAFPFILTGIRITVVTAVGIAVFGTFVGGGGLGSVLYRGMRIQDFEVILQGTLCLMGMSVVFDYLLGLLEKKVGGMDEKEGN